jgi:hypothetical protein
MERLRLWIESSLSKEEHQNRVYANSRPPPLRTSSTYDDDEAFNNVALNLLSRYEALKLSVEEALSSTLVSPKQRASFLDGLCARRYRSSHHMSPNTASLVSGVERVFGKALKDMVENESHGGNTVYHLHNNPHASGRSTKKKKHRRFFPEIDASSSSSASTRSSGGGGALFRKRRIQNIDWRLTEAIERVESLRLDGDTPPPHQGQQGGGFVGTGSYEPPRAE